MSNIKILGNASGTGTITLQAPNTNTDRTINLPDTTGTLIDSSGQNADQWYKNTDHTGDGTVTGWSNQFAAMMGGKIGAGMSESSGVWTFPTTGVWLIHSKFYWNASYNDSDWIYVQLQTSDDNFSSTKSSNHIDAITTEDEGWQGSMFHNFLFDCQDTSNDKIKFVAGSVTGSNKIVGGTSGSMYTWIRFTRMGDT